MSIHKYLLLIISLIFLFSANRALAVTEFISVVDTGGAGDYSTLSAWQLNNHVDLTAATTLVFSYDASSGTIADGDPVSTDGGASTATLVHETATQILLSGISGSFDDNDVVTDGTNTVTLSNAGDSAISVASCQGSDADTAAVTIEGWDTSDTNYIKVYTTTANRHDGKWSDTKYRLTLSSTALTISESYVTIEGLQIHGTNASGSNNQIYSNSVLSDILIDSCILRGNGNTAFGSNVGITLGGISDGSSWKVINSIFYDQKSYGIHESYSTGTTLEVYNCVFYNIFGTGILQRRSTLTVKNTAVFNTSDDFFDDNGGLTIDYCASDDGDGDHAVTPSDWSTVFEDYANGDFHLKSTDTDLKDAGTDLTAQGFTDDIDGQTRDQNSNGWDIGADEAAEKIYRSVGPSASSYLERGIDDGGNNLNISGSTATFASDLGTDVGVGDVVLYDSNLDNSLTSADSIAFIKSRTDNQNYVIQIETGAVPSDMSTPNDTWEIYRAHTSLSNAESGTKNTNIPIAFTGGNRDLVANNEQWNIACYANGSTADQTAVTIEGWTTSTANYLRIYTPISASEVGTTQRHSGVADTGYRLVPNATSTGIANYEENVRIEGIAVGGTNWNAAGTRAAFRNYASGLNDIRISYCLFYNLYNEGVSNACGYYSNISATGEVKIWNNIIYSDGTAKATDYGIWLAYSASGKKYYIYSNTIVDMGLGIRGPASPSDTLPDLKNNLIQGTNTNYGTANWGTTSNNLSEDATSPNNEHDNKVVDFADENGNDFHLDSINTNAKDQGTSLSSDGNLSFSDDIDGDTRPGPYWDIGADEYPATVKVEFKGITEFLGNIEIK